MKKVFIGIVIGFLIALGVYYSLTLFSSQEWLSNDFARVTFVNESGKTLKKVMLQHERGTLEAREVKDHAELRFIFENQGENSYKIWATFDNDSTLTSDGPYFELGYRGVVTITDSAIVIKDNW
jgi:putative heme iron utilization protein